jgi:hypothetical protein
MSQNSGLIRGKRRVIPGVAPETSLPHSLPRE